MHGCCCSGGTARSLVRSRSLPRCLPQPTPSPPAIEPNLRLPSLQPRPARVGVDDAFCAGSPPHPHPPTRALELDTARMASVTPAKKAGKKKSWKHIVARPSVPRLHTIIEAGSLETVAKRLGT